MERMEDVVIIGAGIAGLATAVALMRVGVRALVLERSEELRATGAGLGLFPNAWLALDALGVAHKLATIYAHTNKGCVTNVRTGTIQEVSLTGRDRDGAGPKLVHRKALLEALAEELPTNTIRFSSKLTSLETEEAEGSSIAILQMEDGTIIKTKILIGCDGVHSMVAHWLGLSKPVNSGRSAVRGLAVFPQGHGFKQEFQQFLDEDVRAGFCPLSDKDIYWFVVICNSNPKGKDMEAGNPESIQREVMENFAKEFPPIFLDVVRHSDLSSLTMAPLMLRLPWDVILGNVCRGRITVAGDAMHPMTPDLGQGGCSALEDAVVLVRHIGESLIRNGRLVPSEADNALERYARERRWRAAGLITASYLSGWMQQHGSAWWMKFLRNVIFYRFLYKRLLNAAENDCGKLPEISPSSEFESHTKIE